MWGDQGSSGEQPVSHQVARVPTEQPNELDVFLLLSCHCNQPISRNIKTTCLSWFRLLSRDLSGHEQSEGSCGRD